MFLDSTQLILQYIQGKFWLITAIVISSVYLCILYKMVIKGFRDQGVYPANGPKFYLAQAYLSFMWPAPLYLVLRITEYI